MKEKDGLLLPQEHECHFRGRLARSFKQPELKERSIWYIDPGEKYLGWAMTDIEGRLRLTCWAGSRASARSRMR